MMIKRYVSLFCTAVLCIPLFLCACAAEDAWTGPGTSAGTPQPGASLSAGVPAPSGEAASAPSEGDTPSQTSPAETACAGSVPYTLFLGAAVQIYGGPSYDCSYVQAVGQDGIYTIQEETWDNEGNLWGRLKSGAGWVDLTYVRSSESENAPVAAIFADDTVLSGGNYLEHIEDDSEYMVKIIFLAREPLADVKLTSLQPKGDSYETVETLCELEGLSPEMPFVAGVVYYGDMTAYGLSFTDSSGTMRCYAVYISGRNGGLVLDEYDP